MSHLNHYMTSSSDTTPGLFKLKNYAITPPWCKQQYTYADIQAAYLAGKSSIEFREWYKNHTFEITKENV